MTQQSTLQPKMSNNMAGMCSYCQNSAQNHFICGHNSCQNCFKTNCHNLENRTFLDGKRYIGISYPACVKPSGDKVIANFSDQTALCPPICNRHQIEITIYCCDCETVLCNKCKMNGHSRHRSFMFSEAENEMKAGMKRKLLCLEAKQDECKTLKRQIDKCLQNVIINEKKNKDRIRTTAKEAKELVLEECNKIIEAIEGKVEIILGELKAESHEMITMFNNKKEVIESRISKNQELLEQCRELLNKSSINYANQMIDFFQKSTSSILDDNDVNLPYLFEEKNDNFQKHFTCLIQPAKTCSDYEIARPLKSFSLPSSDIRSADILSCQNNKLLIGKSHSETLLIYNAFDESKCIVQVPKTKNAVLLKSADIVSVSEDVVTITSQKSNLLFETKFKRIITLYLHSDDNLYLVDGCHYVHLSKDSGRTWMKLFRKSTDGQCSRLLVLNTEMESDKQKFWIIEGRPSVSNWQLVEYIVKGSQGKQRLAKVKYYCSVRITK